MASFDELVSALSADMPKKGVSYAGGIGFGDYGTNNNSNNILTDYADAGLENTPFAGEGIDVKPVRRRTSKLGQAIASATDIWNMIQGDQNAYVGQTMERINAADKARMEEDPEGYTIDLNRAKVLSQKAIEEKDPTKKAIYGREIKKLLPKETQGLDDLTASEYFTSTDNKLKLEQMKGLNKLQQIQAQNAGKLDLQALKNASAEDIAKMKTETQWDIAKLNNEIKQSIADGNNDRAILLAQMVTDRQIDLANLNNAAKLKQTEMQQTGAMERVQAQQEGALERTNVQQGGANYRANLAAESAEKRVAMQQEGANYRAGLKSEKDKQVSAEAKIALDKATSFDAIQQMKQLNGSAGRWQYQGEPDSINFWKRVLPGDTYEVSVQEGSETAKAYQKFEGLAKQIVQNQLRQIYGAQFTEKEGERFFKSMGLSPVLAPDVRWELFTNQINDLRVKNGYEAIDFGGATNPTGNTKIKSIKRIG